MPPLEKWKNVKRERWFFERIYVFFRDKKEARLGQNGFYVVLSNGFIHVEQKMLLLKMFWVARVHLLQKR